MGNSLVEERQLLTGICTKELLGNAGFCTSGTTGTVPFFPRKIGPWIGVTFGVRCDNGMLGSSVIKS